LLARVRSRSRSLSNRIVKDAVFMFYIVIRTKLFVKTFGDEGSGVRHKY